MTVGRKLALYIILVSYTAENSCPNVLSVIRNGNLSLRKLWGKTCFRYEAFLLIGGGYSPLLYVKEDPPPPLPRNVSYAMQYKRCITHLSSKSSIGRKSMICGINCDWSIKSKSCSLWGGNPNREKKEKKYIKIITKSVKKNLKKEGMNFSINQFLTLFFYYFSPFFILPFFHLLSLWVFPSCFVGWIWCNLDVTPTFENMVNLYI